MTLQTWTTRADVPPAAWAAMCSDVRDILTVTAATTGGTVTAPGGSAPPIITGERIAFTVTTPGGGPLTVDMTRTAGSGQVETSAVHTTGLVYLTLMRAGKHWGPLVQTTSDAGTQARAFADALRERLFGPADRALTGGYPLAPVDQARGIVRTAFERLTDPARPQPDDVVGYLTAAITELTAERDGRAAVTP